MVEESKYCSEVIKTYFKKQLRLKDIKNSIKCWISDNDYVDNDVKVTDHCHIT